MSATTTAPTPGDVVEPAARRGMAQAGLIRIIGIYQGFRAGKASPCRFWPTCSAYAVEAVDRHGAGRGSVLALRRITRCHPWGGHGVDPVPE